MNITINNNFMKEQYIFESYVNITINNNFMKEQYIFESKLLLIGDIFNII